MYANPGIYIPRKFGLQFQNPCLHIWEPKHLSRDDISLEARPGDFNKKLGPAQPKGSAFNPGDFNGRVKRKSLQIKYAPHDGKQV